MSPKLFGGQEIFFTFSPSTEAQKAKRPRTKKLCNLSKFSNSGGDLAEREIGWCMVDDT